MGEIERVLQGIRREEDEPGDLSPEPDRPRHPAWNRQLKTVPRPSVGAGSAGGGTAIPEEGVSLEEARSMIRTSLADYTALPTPTHALLVLAAPGTGKTTRAVESAETAASQGKRVLYAGPRHDFFADVRQLASHPEWC